MSTHLALSQVINVLLKAFSAPRFIGFLRVLFVTRVPLCVSRLAQQCVYPQAFLHPSLVLQSQLSPTAAVLSPPYLDYSSAYSHYAPTALEQYPYTPSPSLSSGYLSYSFSPSTPAPALSAASPTPPAGVHPPLAALTAMPAVPQAFLHYPLHQPDRMQWAAPRGAEAANWWVKTGWLLTCDIIRMRLYTESVM